MDQRACQSRPAALLADRRRLLVILALVLTAVCGVAACVTVNVEEEPAPAPAPEPAPVPEPPPPRPPPTSNGGTIGSMVGKRIPAFTPWPPPKPSARLDLPREAVVSRPDAKSLGDVGDVLRGALEDRGYYELSFYSVPDGFALATRLERIEDDGRPAPEPGRWSTSTAPVKFELADILKRLAGAPPGRFRVILFVVTTEAFTLDSRTVTSSEALGWVSGGANKLPKQYYRIPIADGTDCTALVYEFERLPVEPTGKQVARIGAREHLDRSGLSKSLGIRW